jgi:carbonic anhydrase
MFPHFGLGTLPMAGAAARGAGATTNPASMRPSPFKFVPRGPIVRLDGCACAGNVRAAAVCTTGGRPDMRHVRLVIAALVVAVLAGGSAGGAGDTAASALERLVAGNARFVRDAAAPLPIDAVRRQAQLKGQSPFAIVLSCSDSRVPPEVIFNVGLGDLFVIRTAGEVVDRAVLASVEYGAERLKAPLVVVMGHETCGAVTAAVESKAGAPSMGPNLDALVGAIKPAFVRMNAPADLDHLRDAILANVEQVVNDLLARSATVRRLAAAGELQLVGAYYEFSSGRVRFSEPARVPSEPAAKDASVHK